jgi:D-glycero-D-manno-heptose 1,7-bisphosphate phosphatase
MVDAAPRRAAFLDRDGVINEERGYVHLAQDFVCLPGAIAGLRSLQNAGYVLVVITNQAGIARGLYAETDFDTLTQHMRSLLRSHGVTLAGVYHCPHHPTAGLGAYRIACDCRKPKPGMLLRAAGELRLDLATSVLVGDKQSDIRAGRAAGLRRCVLVTSGCAVTAEDAALADACKPGLREAAAWLVDPRNQD